MTESVYLNGYIYHMMHYENLPNVLRKGSLLSREALNREGINPKSIAYESVQNRRSRVFIWDAFANAYCNLHRYVPFYFVAKSPMLYVQHKQGVQDQIILLEVGRSVLKEANGLFTAGNAANQQLSDGEEQVFVVPKTAEYNVCRRVYIPRGPQGTNPNRSDIYADTKYLQELQWDVIYRRKMAEDWKETMRIRSAEVLIRDSLSASRIDRIYVETKTLEQSIDVFLKSYWNSVRYPTPSVHYKPELFVQ